MQWWKSNVTIHLFHVFMYLVEKYGVVNHVCVFAFIIIQSTLPDPDYPCHLNQLFFLFLAVYVLLRIIRTTSHPAQMLRSLEKPV